MFENKNVRIILYIAIMFVLTFTWNWLDDGSEATQKENTKVVLNEVVHSVFYVPLYVAIENGYFSEEGLDVTLQVGNGADKSMTALLSGEANIILAGAESSMYVQSNENGKEIVNIGQLTKRAGNFLVAKEKADNFTWEDVKGKKIIGGRPGGMPEIMLEHILKEHGINPTTDVNITTNLDFTATTGAFATGEYDYTMEFEPNATKIETEGYGYVVASLGTDGGEIPYTSFITTKEYAKDNSETLEKFLNAIYKAQKFLVETDSSELAKIISPQFDSVPIDQLEIIIERYKSQDTWTLNPLCNVESYEKLEQILLKAGTLTSEIDTSALVDNSIARKVVGENGGN